MSVNKKTPKKTSNKQVKSSSKPKESKEALFLRVATPRVERILKALRILGNCSKRNNYSYSQEQTVKIYSTIQESLDSMIGKFTPSKQEQESFEF